MIKAHTLVSYAQYNEDTVLAALLEGVDKGFYVDVGANYPTVDSVTRMFYDKGWSGINIEPIPSLYKQLHRSRKRDINLGIGVGDVAGELEFFENLDIPGHSSFIKSEATQQSENIKIHTVPIKTLKQVFFDNKVHDVHFMKIDVEGYEEPVIKGNDWKKYRPWVICIEANHRKTNWQSILKKNRYRLFINDGLNEYYLSEEQWQRTEGFAERVVKISYNTLKQHHYQSWREDYRQLKAVTKLNETHFSILNELRAENARLQYENKFSILNKSYRDKLKLGARALTAGFTKHEKKIK